MSAMFLFYSLCFFDFLYEHKTFLWPLLYTSHLWERTCTSYLSLVLSHNEYETIPCPKKEHYM